MGKIHHSVFFWAILLAAVFGGWKLFWFLTDDAYIAFRYISNWQAGLGLVWNPLPFNPVEGYTSFLWVILLGTLWTLTGLEPPVTANWVSLFFGYGTLFMVYLFFRALDLPRVVRPFRYRLLALVLLGIIVNRTFLIWLSSGLETALFNFFFIWWLYETCVGFRLKSKAWIFRLASSALGAYLTRPDGLLLIPASLLLIFWAFRMRKGDVFGLWAHDWVWAFPLLGVPTHLIWRKFFYGEWLPNTFYAKVVEPWPEIGILYAASFLLEYGLWLWLIIVGVWVGHSLKGVGRLTVQELIKRVQHNFNLWIGVGITAFHFGYYTFVVGGDHFEYRVYSHLIPLFFITAVWFLTRLTSRMGVIVPTVLLLVLVSLPLPWTHWWQTKDLNTREQTFFLQTKMRPFFPSFFQPVVGVWDDWQGLMIPRMVGTRHQEHKIFHLHQTANLPTREEGASIDWQERAVWEQGAVGVAGWVLPEVALIDNKGLNDWVIARHPVDLCQGNRMMAHDRLPPPGYVQCFQPNVWQDEQGIGVVERDDPLTDQEIDACEEEFIRKIKNS